MKALVRSLLPHLTLFLVLLIILATPSAAQWVWNPTVNNAVCTAAKLQSVPQICNDGSGGVIIAWQDRRGSSMDIYAQRLNSTGVPQWTADGIPVCAASGDQSGLQILPDGSGGAIIVWEDSRQGSGEQDIYAQRISSAGTAMWTADGVPICTATWDQRGAHICGDGSGGAIIAWRDGRGNDRDIYAQRINGAGTVQWTADGEIVCGAPDEQTYLKICTDGGGGAIIVWRDEQGPDYNIYTQRIDASGSVQWTANGVAVCTAADHQGYPQICTDGSGGAIMSWIDYRNVTTTSTDVYAQLVNAAGSVQWTADGIPVCTAAGAQQAAQMCSDGSGGAVIAWQDLRGSNSDIFAQRISAAGSALWTQHGNPVCTASGTQQGIKICPDGSSGAVIAWQDGRGDWDVYAQNIGSTGTLQWQSSGIAVCTATGLQSSVAICSDGSGATGITWQDLRGSTQDIYASKVNSSGQLVPVELLTFSATQQEEVIVLSWTTATETHNYGFEVQRQTESGDWSVLGFIEGNGSTTEAQSYSFTDRLEDVPTSCNQLRYRLKQIDLDGQYEYTPEVEIQLDQPLPRFALESYPSPSDDQLTVRLALSRDGATSIRLHDIAGRVVMVITPDAVLPAGSHSVRVRTVDVPSGLYLLVVESSEGRRTEKVLIRH